MSLVSFASDWLRVNKDKWERVAMQSEILTFQGLNLRRLDMHVKFIYMQWHFLNISWCGYRLDSCQPWWQDYWVSFTATEECNNRCKILLLEIRMFLTSLKTCVLFIAGQFFITYFVVFNLQCKVCVHACFHVWCLSRIESDWTDTSVNFKLYVL